MSRLSALTFQAPPIICLLVLTFLLFLFPSSGSENQMALKTADKLLHEVKPHSAKAHQKVQVLDCYILMGTQDKKNVEKALEKFMSMAAVRVCVHTVKKQNI